MKVTVEIPDKLYELAQDVFETNGETFDEAIVCNLVAELSVIARVSS